jgi:hypothetical protein
MKFHELVGLIGEEPLFESSMLLAAKDSPAEIRRQLSRWVEAGKLVQIRRGLYALASPFAKARVDPYALATRLRRPSYVSLQSALQYHGVIPEGVPVVTSVTTVRPGRVPTPVGVYIYRHVHRSLFWGYQRVDLLGGQGFYVASPEKALLDLFHLTPGPLDQRFIAELRLDPDGQLDLGRLAELAKQTARPKLVHAAAATARWFRSARDGGLQP